MIDDLICPTCARFSLSARARLQEHLDARLTAFGTEQCASLKATKHGLEKEAQLVVVSPLTRAIQTAILSIDQVRLGWLVQEDQRRPINDRFLSIGFIIYFIDFFVDGFVCMMVSVG